MHHRQSLSPFPDDLSPRKHPRAGFQSITPSQTHTEDNNMITLNSEDPLAPAAPTRGARITWPTACIARSIIPPFNSTIIIGFKPFRGDLIGCLPYWDLVNHSNDQSKWLTNYLIPVWTHDTSDRLNLVIG